MKEILEKTFKENNFEINGEKIDKFNDFFNLLLKFNENINLTYLARRCGKKTFSRFGLCVKLHSAKF